MKGARVECGDGDGKRCSRWWMVCMRDEWFEQFMNPIKSVFQFLSTRLYSLGIPETVKLNIAVKSKGNE